MKAAEYKAARIELRWTHQHLADVLGVRLRTAYRYAAGEQEIPESAARLLRLLVVLHFTFTGEKFDDIVEQITP